MSYIPRLKREYKETVISNLKKEFEYNNIMQVPRLQKIVISKGVGAAEIYYIDTIIFLAPMTSSRIGDGRQK